jgi:hypothetical protein
MLYSYSTLQVVTESDHGGIAAVALMARDLGLLHTYVYRLPNNGSLYLVILPVGSKALRKEDDAHLKALAKINLFIEEHNQQKGGRYLVALQTRMIEPDSEDTPLGSIIYETPDVEEE